jgi:hypothetical protein
LIGGALVFLRKHLDAHLKAELADDAGDDPLEDRVVFVEGDKIEPLSFKLGAVSTLLINVEEERQLRPAELYARRADDDTPRWGQPDIRLVLYVLFVARFKQYDLAWDHLSKIIQRFQHIRVFERETTPTLPQGIDKLVLELVTLDFAQQNEVWNALRITHHPSILYRVKLITLRDEQLETPARIEQAILNLKRKP